MMGDTIDEGLVRALLQEQHRDLAHLAVELLAVGWDNAVFRLGPALTVRLPRRPEGAALIVHEQHWVASLVAGLPGPEDGGLATSAPVRTGVPGCGYRWYWNVGPWLPGRPAAADPPTDPFDAARRLGTFLGAFRRPAPADAPINPFRGIPLAERGEALVRALDRIDELGRSLGTGVERSALEARWADLASTTPWAGPPQWLHGDLHPANLLAHEGRLAAVIDFGDLTSGDPAGDLSVAWLLLPPHARSAFREAAGGDAGVDDDTWARAEAWALALSVAYLAGPMITPSLIAVAERTLTELAGPDR